MNTQHPRTAAIDRLLPRVSDSNRDGLATHLQLSRNEGIREASLYSFAKSVQNGDALLKGRSFLAASPQDYMRVVQGFKAIYSPQSVRIRVVNLRKHVRWVHKVDRVGVQYGQVPANYADIERALQVRREKEQVVGQVIRPEHMAALLACIPQRACLAHGFALDVRDRALLAVLRASGFRGGELVSLAIKDVSLEGDLAKLTLSEQSVHLLRLLGSDGDLKTGPRAIYIKEGVAELRAWLTIHPARDNPEAPLWVNADSKEIRAFTTVSLRKLVRKAVAWAGFASHYPAALTPHDFRHTCATEKASHPFNWNEPQLCDYFGWAPGSKTPGTYVHLTIEQQRQRILRDAQAIAAAKPEAAPQMSALVDLLRSALGQLATPAAA
jgi:integrase